MENKKKNNWYKVIIGTMVILLLGVGIQHLDYGHINYLVVY